MHLKCEGGGKPLAFILSGGERHEAAFFESLLNEGGVKRAGSGRPRSRPACVVGGDKGYSYPSLRQALRRKGIRAAIPARSNQRYVRALDKAMYRERNRVERSVGRLKQLRRIATRYEKRAESYLAVLTLAAIILWL